MEEYKTWFSKAKEDLLWTKHSLEGEIYYGACFSAQQSAEKCLKAFLIYHKSSLRKVHDLLALLEECVEIDKEYDKIRELLEVLSPYYIETRYPIYEDLIVFDKKRAEQAYEFAQKVIEFTQNRISS